MKNTFILIHKSTDGTKGGSQSPEAHLAQTLERDLEILTLVFSFAFPTKPYWARLVFFPIHLLSIDGD